MATLLGESGVDAVVWLFGIWGTGTGRLWMCWWRRGVTLGQQPLISPSLESKQPMYLPCEGFALQSQACSTGTACDDLGVPLSSQLLFSSWAPLTLRFGCISLCCLVLKMKSEL